MLDEDVVSVCPVVSEGIEICAVGKGKDVVVTEDCIVALGA